ncbi:DUF3261 domain-containing protein [Shewanella profunda]|uniref:DUF3261 domain-containing protein n=1 Tax=Shewanella profunda TaxID=254793 RepID=UPI00200E9180|nr:DUF3261 domain-containing protein [Shewanella profunda]MCL1091071.1 DUF3261 domain-containing protein [Shewanella profunda]
MSLNRNATLLILLSLLLASQLMTGCTQFLLRQTCVGLANDVRYCLAPLPHNFVSVTERSLNESAPTLPNPQTNSNAGVSSLSLSQKVSIKIDSESHELLTQLELEGERMTLVGLAPLGQALFTLVYDGNTLNSGQSVLLGDNFKAEYLMAMMQLIYWPEQSIRAHLEGGQLVTEVCDIQGNTAPCRRYYRQQSLDSKDEQQPYFLQITYRQNADEPLWQAHIHLTMPQAKFELEIQPI